MQANRLGRLLGRIAVGLVALWVCVMGAALWIGPETRAWLALLVYLPYPLYLLPALVALLWSVALGWFWRGLAAGSLVLSVTVLMGLCWGQPDEGHGPLRVMTYNAKAMLALQRPDGVAQLAWEVQQHDPDVLLMQDAGELMSSHRVSREALRAVLGDRQVQAFGQYIVASRWPLADCAAREMPYRGKSHTYMRCTLKAPGQDIALFNVHFVTPRQGLNATRHEGLGGLEDWAANVADRLTQASIVAEALRGTREPVILAGDLNAPESSMVVQSLLGTGLRDAFSSAARGYGYTHGHSLRPGISFLRIDHILVSPQLGVAAVEVGGKIASEHRPVIADLWLHRP